MTPTIDTNLHPLGTHRVLEPAGAMPQSAFRLDNTPIAHANEILCEVEVLNIDSASFKQIFDVESGDATRIGEHVARIVAQRGKQHNPVTGSGGMFIGRVLAVGERLCGEVELQVGDRIASLVSLTLTPLHIRKVTRVCTKTGRVWIEGSAILFERSLWAKLPLDIDENVALAVLDVAGAPAQVARLCKPGQSVVVIGADGKSGMLSCAHAKRVVGANGRVIGVAPSADTEAARLLQSEGFVDTFVVADARDTLGVSGQIEALLPELADVVINCVNVPGTELASILCTKEDGTLYFFSMSTSFTAAALGAEGAAKDITMIVGNGYARDHAEIALQTLRDFPAIHAYFNAKYARS
ncbi:MAG TPA: L-erythro-3,5-diaminohexanoate dehydrogenase [Candidatus Dormibacteraeota bacterium]|nr:L-erythro-3,5-diaminohexanoate dehydrogenase [Candidatus Dormibacteraeota bacterium]